MNLPWFTYQSGKETSSLVIAGIAVVWLPLYPNGKITKEQTQVQASPCIHNK